MGVPQFGIASPADVAAVEDKVDTVITNLAIVDGVVDGIDAKADSIETKVDTVDGVVDEINTKADDLPTKSDAPLLRVYPSLANPVSVSTGEASWAQGDWTEIVPVNTITTPFWALGLTCAPPYNVYRQIEIGIGASGSEVIVATVTLGNFAVAENIHYIVLPVKIAANTRVAMRAADAHTAIGAYPCYFLYATGL